MIATTFKQIEHAAWVDKAAIYDDLAGALTGQAIGAILESLGDLKGKHLLDVACGTGHLVGAAAGRGADVEGVDFAAPMVAKATENYPGLKFLAGDGEALAYEDASFDAVTCCFGLLHMEQPDKAIHEAWRILRRGGRFAFTVWHGPDQGGEFFALVGRAMQKHGSSNILLPPAPDALRFTDASKCVSALKAAGFASPRIAKIPLVWRGDKPEDVLDFIYKVTVRTSMVLQAQTDTTRQNVHRAVVRDAEQYRKAEGIELAWPAALVTALKP